MREMGIPAYFSYIIKNYSNIIRNIHYFHNNDVMGLNNLYMDCNSIIYDSVRNIEKKDEKINKIDFENSVIEDVILNIQKYIRVIKPNRTVFIAFDGVAPFAKMMQQRTRRYKSDYLSKMNKDANSQEKWNTSSITPGTEFMEKLSQRIYLEFKHTETKYGVKEMKISCSDEKGEGEHKLMEFIRESQYENDTVALYGLDADLIMLSIFHLKFCKNIYVFREAPEFIKSSIPIQVQENNANNLYFLDIGNLATSIVNEMRCKFQDKHRTNDYIFLCFLLGNDFLPHFPAMNIRTHGIDVLMEIYRNHIGMHPDRFFISKETNKIQWKNVGIFLNEVAKNEHQYLINEYFVRDKFDKRRWPENTPQEKEEIFSNIPVIFRAEEKYICPEEPGWEKRYYKTLFHNITSENRKDVCMNYLEGLEWVYKYYSSGCPDWKWKYNYHYPPLFADLCKYIPHFEMDFINENNMQSFSSEVQLSFVLPKRQLVLLSKNIRDFLISNYEEYYPEHYEFQWAFCRYFWESHPVLPEVPVELLQQWDVQFRMHKIKN
jgi:5'-3' exonuclease